MADPQTILLQATTVSIDGHALAIEGPPGSGKSSLALALIDRGAGLIGDDGVQLTREDQTIVASAPPNIAGMIELHGIGIVKMPLAAPAPLALILTLGAEPDRLPERAPRHDILGLSIPVLPFDPGNIAPAERAQWALKIHGI